ncbi:MAG TPA: hypothetical protein VNW99_07345 [Cytophagaceae bacterium]|jgi:DNA-binding beta-propeller fold protein YncE|nr:hypothetical protein [Cytophagaceae bacterium]
MLSALLHYKRFFFLLFTLFSFTLFFSNSFSQNYPFVKEYGGHTLPTPLHQFEFDVTGVAVDAGGFVYVSDGSPCITKFNSAGTFIKRWAGDFVNSIGTLNTPERIALDPSGNLFVVSRGDHRVVKYTNNGAVLLEWGGLGTADGKFNNPYGVAVDAAGNVYVTDGNNNRIQKFDNNGNF